MQLHGSIPSRSTCNTGLFTRPTTLIGLIMIGLAVSSVARAQVVKTPEMATIRKTDLAGIDRNNVNAWINQEVQKLFTATDDKALQTQGQGFYQAIATNAKAADATPKFRDGVAAILAEAFTKHYKSATNRRPLAAVYVLMALGQVAQPTPTVVDAFKLGLTDTTPGGRLMAAKGLLAIRDRINDEQWRSLLPIVQKSASTESNTFTLDGLYKLATVATGPRLETAIPVVLDIIEARLTRLDQKKGWPGLADAEAVKWLGDKLSSVQNAQMQNRATLAIAKVLTNAAYAYIGKPVENRLEELEKTIRAAEAQLKKNVTARAASAKIPSPDVTSTMLENGAGQQENMLTALNKWIGTAKDAGTLNGPPFNFDRGLKITPQSPASQPAAK